MAINIDMEKIKLPRPCAMIVVIQTRIHLETVK